MMKMQSENRKKKKNLKKRTLFGIIVFLSMIILGGLVFLHTKAFESFLLRKASHYLETQQNLTLTIESFDLSPLRLSVVLNGVEIQPLPNKEAFIEHFSARKLVLNLGASTLFARKIHVQEVQIISPHLALSQQRSQIKTVKAGPVPSKRSMSLRIDKFQMDDGFIGFQNREVPVNAKMANIELKGNYQKSLNLHSGYIRSGSGELLFKDSRVLLHKLHTEFEFDDESLKIITLEVQTDPLSLSAAGVIRDFLQAPLIDVEMKGTLNLNRLKDIFPIEHEMAGVLSFSASVEGAEKEVRLRGNIEGRDAIVADIPIPIIRASFHNSKEYIAVDSFELALKNGNFTGKAGLDLSESRVSTAELEWNDVDFSNFEKLAPRILPYLSSVTSGRLSAKWEALALDSVQARGEIRFEPKSQPLPAAEERYELRGNIGFETSGGQAKLIPSSLTLKQTTVSFSGTVDSTKKFKTTFGIEVKDLSEMSIFITRLAAANLVPGNLVDIPFPSSGQISLAGEARGTTAAPEMTLTLKGRHITLNDLGIPQMEGRFTFDRTGFGIFGFNMQLAHGSIQSQGRLSYYLGDNSFGDKSELTISADQVDLAPIASSFRLKSSLKGLLSGKVEFSGSPKNPKLKFLTSSENLALNNEDISLAELQGQISNHRLQLERIKIRKGGGILEGKLGVDLVSKEFQADLEGRDIDLSDFKTAVLHDTALSGTARFQFKGQGTLEKPVFSLQAAVERITVASAYLERFDVTADSDGQAITLLAKTPLGQTSLDAQLLLQEPFTLRGRLITQALDAWTALRYQVEPLPSPVSSEITAKADFTVPLKNWKQAAARIDFEQLAFRYINNTFQNHQPFNIQVNSHGIELEPVQIKGPEMQLTLSGRLPFSDVIPGQIVMDGAVNLRILEAFLPNTEIAGKLVLSGNVSGTVARPSVNAQIELRDSLLEISAVPYTLHDITLSAGIINNVLDLEEFAVGIDGGRISAVGKIHLPLSFKEALPQAIGQSRLAQNEITLTLSALDLGRLVDLFPDKPPTDVGGSIEGVIRLRGDFLSPEHIELEGELSKLELLLSKLKMKNEDKIRFHINEKTLRWDDFRLSGGDSFIQSGLTLTLDESPQLDGHLSANLNASILTPLFEGIILDGNFSLDMEWKGPLDNIGLKGKGHLANGLFQLQDIPFLATEMEGDLVASYGEPVTFEVAGLFNGGKTTARGRIDIVSDTLKSAELEVAAEQVQVNYPEGFQGLADGRLSLSKGEQRWYLSGELGFTQSYFNADIYPGSELIKTLRSQQRALKSDIPVRIRDVNLAIDVVTINPLIIDNNVASLELDSNIRIGGTVVEPRLSGYVRNREAGEIIFGNRSYEVEQVSMDYSDADPLEGRVNVIAHTQMRHKQENLNVTLVASGPITNLNFSLSSDPARSQIELASLLITGYGTERLRDEAANVLGNQLMLYFLSPLASPFTRGLKNFLGAEDVRIEPINIAAEENPGARFTFRKGLVPMLDLVYSIDISNTQRQTWVLDYSLSRHFGIQSFAKDDGSYGGSVSHRFFLGSPSRIGTFAFSRRVKRYKIKDIVFSGSQQFSKDVLGKVTRDLKRGSLFYYKNLRKASDKLTAFYKKNDYLNAVISSSPGYREDDTVVITFQTDPKDPARIVFVGDPIKNSLQKKVISKWNGRLPEEMSVAEAEKRIRLDLNSKGYIEAEVTGSKTEEDKESIYVIFVHFGPKYRIGQFSISGESAVSAKSIKKTVAGLPRAKGKGLWALLYDFKRSKLRIENLYEEMGFQGVVIDYPEISMDKETKTVDIALPVQQGLQSIVHSVDVTGNKNFSLSELRAILNLKESDAFSPIMLAADTNLLYSFYRSHGYHDVSIDVQTFFGEDQAQAGIVYNISEGNVHLISAILISGNNRTPEHVIRRELAFHEGDPLNMEQIIASQKKLYDLLVFRTVNIRPEPIAQQAARARVVVEVQEDPRFGVGYGLRYNSEEKLEVFGQVDLINLFGRGRSGLIFYRQNDRQKDFRFSLKEPYLFGKRFNTLYTVSYLDEILAGFKSEEFGLAIQQTLPLPFDSSISYLFRLNRVHTFELDPIGPFPFDLTLFTPEFQVFWVRDTRLNRINAKQGSFLSLSSRYSPTFLKTDLNYISFFGQYSLYVRIHPLLIWASNYRIGLADAFDQVLIPSRRYYAGGANSIRGFERDMVGPYDPYLNRAIGGEALFVVNQELRFPVFRWIEGVAFFDVGNVYRYINELNPFDVRTAAGFGIRLNTPAIFIRLDYGINLSPREFEPRTVFYISIGQAF